MIIRADASVVGGTGHIVRTFALAEELELQGHEVIFISSIDGVPWLDQLFSNSNFSLLSANPNQLPINQILELNPDWVIVDSYKIDSAEISKLNCQVPVLAVIDGTNRGMEATLYLDQEINAWNNYSRKEYSQSGLFGEQYCLIRKEIQELSKHRQVDPKTKHVVIMLGGSDATGLTPKLVDAICDSTRKFNLQVVGTSNSNVIVDDLINNKPVTYIPSSSQIWSKIYNADVAITAAGTSLFEFGALNIPTIGLALVENQIGNLHSFQEAGLIKGINLLSHNSSKFREVTNLLDAYLDIGESKAFPPKIQIDGLGAARVVLEMKKRLN